MLSLTPQLQIIAEYCEQVLFAFKLFTFPEIWEDDNFCGRRKHLTHLDSCLEGRNLNKKQFVFYSFFFCGRN